LQYVDKNKWESVTKRVWNNENQSFRIIHPRPPVSNYLHEDDLRIFSAFTDKRFLAHEWKGLVIAVATDNIPLHTKASTFTIRELSLRRFVKASCEQKVYLAEQFDIDYVYVSKFICKQFIRIDESEEGLVLYKYQK
jgi:hypothetical protein